MSLLFALIDKALGDSLGAGFEVADTALNIAGKVVDTTINVAAEATVIADDILENVPGYSLTKDKVGDAIAAAHEAKQKKNSTQIIDDKKPQNTGSKINKMDQLINKIDYKLKQREQNYNSMTKIDQLKQRPTNPLAVLLGNKGLNSLLKKNPDCIKFVACGKRWSKIHAHLFDPLPIIDWHRMTFEYYNLDGDVVFSIKGKESYIGKCFDIDIHNDKDEVVGEVREKIIAMRIPLIHEWEPHNYSLYVHGNLLGTIKTTFKGPGMNKKYDLKILGEKWTATRNLANSKYVVLNDKKEKMLEVTGINSFTLPLDYCYSMDINRNLSTEVAITIFSALLASAFSSQK